MSMLDRPISEFDGPVDSVRIPVLPPTGQCKPFQEVLVELAGAAEVPGLHPRRRQRASSATTPTSSSTTRPRRARASASWPAGAARAARRACAASPTRSSGRCTRRTTASSSTTCRRSCQYMRNWNDDYMRWAQSAGLRRDRDPIVIHLYSEFLQRFRLAAQGKRQRASSRPTGCASACRPTSTRCRSTTRRSRSRPPTLSKYPLNAVTQRPMAMYHSWDSQNAWLRQIHTHNYLFVNPLTAQAEGIADGGWMWVESPWGKVRCMCRYSEAVEPGTVWTWNAIGKAAGAWNLTPDANESQRGFLLNHLITRGTAGGRRRHRVEHRPDHRPGRLVRRARAHLHGRRRRAAADLAAVRARDAGARHEQRRRSGARWMAGAGPARRRRASHDAARPGHRPQRLRRLPRLRDELQAVEHLGLGRPAGRRPARTARTRAAPSSTACRPSRSASTRTRRRCTSRRAACTAKTRPACRCAPPAPATSARRTASCSSTTTSASAASTAAGPARTARANSTKTAR